MAEFASSVDIAAPPDDVYDFLVTAEGLTAWLARHAVVDPVPGGAFAVEIAGHPVRGAYLALDRPHRVVVSWGFAGSDDLPPGASTVSFTLEPTADGTRVHLLHADLPEAEVPGHADGWANFLPRLVAAGAGADPGPDVWRPGTPRPAVDGERHP